jgi:ribonuclease D
MLADVSPSRVVAVDFETSGLDPLTCVPLLLAVKGERGPAYVVETDATGVGFLSGNLGLPSKVLLAHNAVFEYMFFRTGVYLPEDVPQRWFCTQVAEALIQSGLRSNDEGEDKRVPLSEVYAKYCGITADKTLQTSFVGVCPETFDPTEAQVAYAAQDVLYLHEVMEAQLRRLESEAFLRVARLEMAVIPPLGEMQLNGFYLNLDRHLAVLTEYEAQEAAQRAKVEATLAALYKRRKERENQERANVYAHLDAEIQAVAALEKLVSVNAKMLEMEAAGKEHLKAHTELWERAVKYNAIVAHATQLLGRVPQPLSKEAVTGLRKVRDANKPLATASTSAATCRCGKPWPRRASSCTSTTGTRRRPPMFSVAAWTRMLSSMLRNRLMPTRCSWSTPRGRRRRRSFRRMVTRYGRRFMQGLVESTRSSTNW